LGKRDFIRYFVNSLGTGITATFLSKLFDVPAAYGLSRFRFIARRLCSHWILSIRLVPPTGFVVPLLIMFKTLEMLDHFFTLILVFTGFLLPFLI
jgi:multiple sugar transport system permease protein